MNLANSTESIDVNQNTFTSRIELSNIEKCNYCSQPIKYLHFYLGTHETCIKIPCGCKGEKQAKENELEKTNKEIEHDIILCRQELHKRSGIKKRYLDSSLRQLQAVKGQEKAIKISNNFINDFNNCCCNYGLIFIGPVGSGKTRIATAICNEIIETMYIDRTKVWNSSYFNKLKIPFKFYSSTELFSLIGTYSEPDEKNLVKQCKKTKLLFIDDIGAEKSSEFRKERLYEIIDERYNQCLPTILTTNLLPQELKGHLGDRSYDRINSSCKTVVLATESQRKSLN